MNGRLSSISDGKESNRNGMNLTLSIKAHTMIQTPESGHLCTYLEYFVLFISEGIGDLGPRSKKSNC